MAEAVEIERPSGSFVSITNDGFEIQSNTGTADDLRAELGIATTKAEKPAKAAVADDTEVIEMPSRAAKPRRDPDAKKSSIQAEIDANIERKRVAKEEADAEETRLTKLREDAKRYQAPIVPQAQPIAAQAPANGTKAPVYDGSDPADPEPKLDAFANDPSGDPYTAWMIARSGHAARVEFRKQQQQQSQTAQRQQADTLYHGRVGALQEKVKAHTAKEPEFQKRIDPAVAEYLKWSTPDAIGVPLGDLVMDAPNTTDLLIYFSEHKAELARISTLHPLQQAMEFGTIQGRMSAQTAIPAPKPKPVSQAKPLIPKVEGLAAAAADDRPDEELTEEEHDQRYSKLRRKYR